jgi:hypothetical protein
MKIAFLTCHDLLQDAPARRADAFEHDLQFATLREGLAGRAEITEIDWRSQIADFEGFDIALLGTAWDYQDRAEEFIARLDELTACGVDVRNRPEVARWNIEKGYLQSLAQHGAPTIPTLWRDDPGEADVAEAFDHFGCDRVVVKRAIGAGAYGQRDFTRAAPPSPGWRLGRPGLIQPFLPSIVSEGEFSVIFIGGEYSHTLVKRAAPGDYRIQSLYGGGESPATLGVDDMRDARAVYDALPFDDLLYARIDMVRGASGRLLLMEAELVEPYLYPVQGPQVGKLLAEALIVKRR